MPEISLTDFVDFSIKTGSTQMSKVREILNRDEYSPAIDFWRPLREGVKDYHFTGAKLDTVMMGLTDPKKIKRYPEALRGYRKFVGKKEIAWFAPRSARWEYGGLSVRVNPELGLEFGGCKYLVKLYFKDEKPTVHRLKLVHCMMQNVLNLDGGLIPAVLDVSNARLIPAAKPLSADIAVMLEAQAIAFMHLWNALSVGKAKGAAGS